LGKGGISSARRRESHGIDSHPRHRRKKDVRRKGEEGLQDFKGKERDVRRDLSSKGKERLGFILRTLRKSIP